MAQEQRLVFGDVARLYERVRPSYPQALVDDVVELSGIDRGGRALEVGAGTGKATRLFAARGVQILAIDPSSQMAAVARRECAGYEGVTVEEHEFEDFDAGGERFRLLFSAQAWHWISPEVRYVRAREALEPGGMLAVFWNRPRWGATPLRGELLEAYRRAGAVKADGEPDPMHPVNDTKPDPRAWEREIAGVAGFSRPQMRCYDWSWTYSADEYLDLLQTHSGHIIRPELERRAIVDEVGKAIEAAGGSIRFEMVAVLCLATAT